MVTFYVSRFTRPPMIIDLQRFVSAERPYWTELDTLLNRLENGGRTVTRVP